MVKIGGMSNERWGALWPLFMDRIQLFRGCGATATGQVIFHFYFCFPVGLINFIKRFICKPLVVTASVIDKLSLKRK